MGNEFGKLNFSVAFNPTSAFPLDARCYFNSLALAKAAAATAESVGSTNTSYYIGQKLLVDDGVSAKWYIIQSDRTLLAEGSSGGDINTSNLGSSLKINEDGTIDVNTTDEILPDCHLPVSSSAVYNQIGNIESALNNI